jgi:hypothetical protein
MVYNTQNHWVCGFCRSLGILSIENTAVWKLDLFPSSGEGRETPILLGPVIEVSSFYGTQQNMCLLPLPADGERSILRKFFSSI